MHFGLGLLRLDPQTFWSLSLREFMALGGARGGDRADGQGRACGADGALAGQGAGCVITSG